MTCRNPGSKKCTHLKLESLNPTEIYDFREDPYQDEGGTHEKSSDDIDDHYQKRVLNPFVPKAWNVTKSSRRRKAFQLVRQSKLNYHGVDDHGGIRSTSNARIKSTVFEYPGMNIVWPLNAMGENLWFSNSWKYWACCPVLWGSSTYMHRIRGLILEILARTIPCKPSWRQK